ncbi:MAG: class I SAM-dependent methyltransferase [Rhodocyclaceae bacterium]|nr:class I SAM-dependent methyltransferase [Rhodocyclaceae bacterium]
MRAPTDDPIVHTPHAPLTEYYADEGARSGFLRGIFDRTAPHYDRIESILALGTGPWYRRQALIRAGLEEGMCIVDIGVGTGLVAREAARLTGNPELVVGVDPSPGMMANAALPPGVRLVEGRAEAIPFPDASFDMLSMGYALRHISDLSVAFHEFFRVLKPGGRLCLLEITRPTQAWSRALMKVYMRGLVPLLARAAGGGAETARLWRYYWDTIDACAPPEKVLATLREAGFAGAIRHLEHGALPMLAEYQAVKPG